MIVEGDVPNTDRDLLKRMFFAAVNAAHPGHQIAINLPPRPKGKTVVIGAGKASAQMAKEFEDAWTFSTVSGLVVVPYGTTNECKHVEVVEAAHPVPDQRGMDAATRILEIVRDLTEDDLVVALISGGGSSLLPAPARGLGLEDERAINKALLASGASISVMNLIRNQFSQIKGGRLALQCWPAKVVTYVVSDVPGDDPAIVASGPTVPNETTRLDARRAVELHGIMLPPAAVRLLATDENLTPLSSDSRFDGNVVLTVASASASLEAAASAALAQGLPALILSDGIEGEATDIGQMHAAISREIARHGRPFAAPCVILSGGETTVTVKAAGIGGRNTEFSLSFADGIEGFAGITALAADTDGIDGNGGCAGTFSDGGSTARMRAAGVDPKLSLKRNDSATAFGAIDDLFVTGPTGTNVNDFRAIIIR